MKRIIALLSSFIFFASPLHAAIEPPYKSIDYCYRIDNISAFPDFVVIARFPAVLGGEITDPVQLKEGECYVRNTRDEIVAVRKELFRASKSVYRDVELRGSVSNSGIRTPVSPVKIYDPQDPRKKIEDVFTIDALDHQTFSLRLAKKIVERDNGTVEEKVYATAEEGLTDPPGPGYEYTDGSTETNRYPGDQQEYYQEIQEKFGPQQWQYLDIIKPCCASYAWYEKNSGKGLITLAVVMFHFYIGGALFVLARRFGVLRRWRAWVPIANLSLFVSLAGQRQRRFVLLCVIIFIFFALVVAASRFSGCRMYTSGLDVCYPEQIRTFFGWFSNFILLYFFVLLCRLYAAFTIRCGRPWWWGPLMVLVPPVGLVLLGIMAWSKPRA